MWVGEVGKEILGLRLQGWGSVRQFCSLQWQLRRLRQRQLRRLLLMGKDLLDSPLCEANSGSSMEDPWFGESVSHDPIFGRMYASVAVFLGGKGGLSLFAISARRQAWESQRCSYPG
jgi:hypothetical protein